MTIQGVEETVRILNTTLRMHKVFKDAEKEHKAKMKQAEKNILAAAEKNFLQEEEHDFIDYKASDIEANFSLDIGRVSVSITFDNGFVDIPKFKNWEPTIIQAEGSTRIGDDTVRLTVVYQLKGLNICKN